MRYIYISSSNVAKYTGHNKYQSLEKTVNELLSKNGIKDVYVPKSNVEDTLSTLSKEKLALLRKELSLPNDCGIDHIEHHIKKEIMFPSYNSLLSEEESKRLVDEKLKDKPIAKEISLGIKQDLRMKRGNIKEDRNLNTIEEKNKISIVKRNSRMYTKELYRCDTYVIILRGKVDGQSDDTVIESKNRTKCLFKELREYERVQLECYMFLTGLKRSLLTEHFNKTEHCIEYHHDEEFWRECIGKISTFMDTHIVPCMRD